MTWFLLVLFAEWEQVPAYVFTEPTFKTQEECMESMQNREHIANYVRRLVIEFARPMPIVAVACIDENQLQETLIPYIPGQET